MSVVRGATVGLIVAVLGVLGASGAWPTARSGPDIERTLRSVAVPGWGAVLAVEGSSVADGAATVWRLDVRGWDWERFSQLPAGTGDLDLLAVVPGRQAVYSVPLSPGGVSVLDLTTREHRMLPAPAIRPSDVTDIAVDADRGRILAWSDGTDELWSYAPGANRWAEVPRTEPWPTAAFPDGQHGYTLMTYDSRADRAVLAVLPLPGRPGSTWLLDPASGRWTRQASRPPALMLGYGEWGSEAVYDPEHRRTVLLGRGTLATYDIDRDRWQVADRGAWPAISYGPRDGPVIDGVTPWPQGIPLGPLARDGPQLLVDDLHHRVVVLGGTSLFRMAGADDEWDLEWRPVREVWGYDVGFNSWTLLTGGQG